MSNDSQLIQKKIKRESRIILMDIKKRFLKEYDENQNKFWFLQNVPYVLTDFMCSKKRQKEVTLLVKFFQGKIDLNVLVMAATIKKLDYQACIGSIAMRNEKPVDYALKHVKTLKSQGWVRLGRYRVHSYPSKYSQRLHLTEFGKNSLDQYIDSYRKYKKGNSIRDDKG